MKNPTRSAGFTNQRGSALVWILITLIVAGGAFAVYWFVIRGGGGGATTALVNRAIPADATMLVGFDPQAILNSPMLADLAKSQGFGVDAIKAELAKVNIKPEALKAVVVGMGANMSDSVAIFAGDIDATALKAGIGAISALSPEAGEMADVLQFESIEGGLVIAGGGELYKKSVSTARGQGQAGLDSNLEKVLGAIDRSAPIWAAGLLPEETTREFKMVGRMLGNTGPPSHAAISVDIGSTMKVKLAVLFPDADAGQMADQIKMLLKLAPMGQLPDGVGDILNSLDLSGSGEVLKASISIPSETLQKLAKAGF